MAVRDRYRYAFLNSGHFPLAFFGGLTLLGCVFIAVSKTSHVDPIVSIAVPILMMLGYFATSLYARKLRLHDEQTGDNLYYMGFLFTLTSLGVSLYQFGTGDSTDDIVHNFGIAVSSTIAGIALRILYNQVRRDPADVERTARLELADMSRRVRTEMESVAREFADFRRVCNQMLEEGFDEIAKQAEHNGIQVRRAFEGMTGEAIKPVKEASGKIADALDETFGRIESRFSEIAERVGTVAALLDKANTSMSDTVAKFETKADTVAEKLGKVIIPDEVLRSDVVPIMKVLTASIAKYAEKTEGFSREQGERTDKLAAAIMQMTASQKHLVEKMTEQGERNAEATSAMLSELLARELARPDVLRPTPEDTLPNGHAVIDPAPQVPPVPPVPPAPPFPPSNHHPAERRTVPPAAPTISVEPSESKSRW